MEDGRQTFLYTSITLRRWKRHLDLLGSDGVSTFIDKILHSDSIIFTTYNHRKTSVNDVK